MSACACWTNDHALGHDGHCCFLIDERAGVSASRWRDWDDICHRPDHTPPPTTPNPGIDETARDHDAEALADLGDVGDLRWDV